MTTPTLKICRGCRDILECNPKGYCADCQKNEWREEAEQNRRKTRFYDTPRWRKFRKWVLWVWWPKHRTEDGITRCVDCLKRLPKSNSKDAVLDHIVPIEQGGEPYDKENMEPRCQRCHNIKRGKERHQ